MEGVGGEAAAERPCAAGRYQGRALLAGFRHGHACRRLRRRGPVPLRRAAGRCACRRSGGVARCAAAARVAPPPTPRSRPPTISAKRHRARQPAAARRAAADRASKPVAAATTPRRAAARRSRRSSRRSAAIRCLARRGSRHQGARYENQAASRTARKTDDGAQAGRPSAAGRAFVLPRCPR